MKDLRREFYTTAGSAGLKVIPDDKRCRILAWLYVYGGSNEQVLEDRIAGHIFYAQGRLNLFGGEMPDAALVPVLLDYIKSVTDYDSPPPWVEELEKEYKLRPNRGEKGK
jgi:hypothetical protein